MSPASRSTWRGFSRRARSFAPGLLPPAAIELVLDLLPPDALLELYPLVLGKRPLGTTAVAACWGAPDRVKHTVLTHVDKDGKAHGCRDHFNGRAPAPLA